MEDQMTQVYALKAMANNYRNGHLWDHLDGEVCMKAADEIKQLKLMLETMTADRDAEKAMKATAREQRDRVTSELTTARECITHVLGLLRADKSTHAQHAIILYQGVPSNEFHQEEPATKVESRKSDTWSKEWKECGFNYSVDQAIRALRYLANNERPIGGQESYNSEHLFQIADELMYTKTELLVKDKS